MGASARRGRPGARPFSASVERGLHLSVGMVILARALVFVAEVLTRPAPDHVERALAGVVLVCVGAAGIRCLAGRPTRVDVVLCTVALLAGALTPRPEAALSGTAESPAVHLIEPMLLVIAVWHRRAAVPLVALGALFVVLRWATADGGGLTGGLPGGLTGGGIDGLLVGLQEAVLVTGTALGALYLVTQMRSASDRAEVALAAQQAEREHRMSAAAVATTAFLHDDLIPTLLTLGSLPDEPRTRSGAAAALARITLADTAEDSSDIAAAIRSVGVREGLDLHVVVRGARTSAPEAVREAMVGAAAEALRNVARHSGQRRATVTVVRRPTSLRITVADHGGGLSGPPGVGMRVAIEGRLRTVGGTARIEGAPGEGTTVVLAWRTRLLARMLGAAPGNDRLVRAAVLDPGRVARRSCLVLAAGYLIAAALLVPDGGPQEPSYLGAAVIAALVLGTTITMTRGPLPSRLLLAVAVVPAVVLALVLPGLSAEGLGGTESWLVEFGALPALAVAWVVSLRTVLLVLVPNALVILLVGLDRGTALADLLHVLLVQPLSALFVAVLVLVCRRAGQVVTTPAASSRSVHAETLEESLGPILGPVVAALRSAEDGDGADHPERHRPELLAQAVRDCLYLPGPAHEQLRAELDALRRVGTHVVTILPEPPAASRTLAAAAGTLRFHHPVRVTLSVSGDEATVVVVPGLGADQLARVTRALPVAWQATGDPEVTVLTGPPDLASVIRRGDRRPVPG